MNSKHKVNKDLAIKEAALCLGKNTSSYRSVVVCLSESLAQLGETWHDTPTENIVKLSEIRIGILDEVKLVLAGVFYLLFHWVCLRNSCH